MYTSHLPSSRKESDINRAFFSNQHYDNFQIMYNNMNNLNKLVIIVFRLVIMHQE